MKALFIVPALNEETAIEPLLREIRALVVPDWLSVDVVVVDDGSTDRTAEIATRMQTPVLRLCKNLGIGGAVQAGLRYALRSGYACALQVDGDGQHPPSQLLKLIEAYRAQPDSGIIIGSRYVTTTGFQSTFLRRFGARWLSLVLRVVAGVRSTDPTSGMRLYGSSALRLFDLTYPYDYPEPESLSVASAANLSIREVSVEMRERQGGQSSIGGLSAAYYMIKVTLAVVLGSLRPLTTVRR